MLDEWLRNKAKWYAKEAGLDVEDEVPAARMVRDADVIIQRLQAQVDELWELNTADHDAIEELTACLRWAVTEHVGKKPAGTLRGQEYERYQRCLAALELHDSISKELDLPLAEFGEE
tara:strand:+ start:172 stop:525 length:354 start_codon:yes stop_codon:yes gene_type:complete